jgi:hypothetical protein
MVPSHKPANSGSKRRIQSNATTRPTSISFPEAKHAPYKNTTFALAVRGAVNK